MGLQMRQDSTIRLAVQGIDSIADIRAVLFLIYFSVCIRRVSSASCHRCRRHCAFASKLTKHLWYSRHPIYAIEVLRSIGPIQLSYSYMAFTKQCFAVVATIMTQIWGPSPVRISGDASVAQQMRLGADGFAEFDFPERIVLIANHQASIPAENNPQLCRSSKVAF